MSAALYYPYIHVRDEGWLKAAALYYDRLYRIIPEYSYEFEPRTDTERALLNETDFLKAAPPKPVAEQAVEEFIIYARKRLKTKAQRDAVVSALQKAGFGGHDFYIHIGKVPERLLAFLDEKNLLRPSNREPGWIRFDEAAGIEYMTFSANKMAEQRAVPVVTDDPAYHRFVRAYRTRDSVPTDATELKLMNFAISVGVPAELSKVSIDKIIKTRSKYADERGTFHQTLAKLAQYVDAPLDEAERNARITKCLVKSGAESMT